MGGEETAEEVLRRLVAIAEDQLRWQKVAVLPQLRDTIERTLTTNQLRQAYEFCDGTTSGTEIAALVNASKASVSGWTRRWRDLGIAFETDARMTQHLVSLRSLGIDLTLPERS